MINHISIVGGTHGNEYTGVFLLRQLREQNFISKHSEKFDIEFIDGNPKAFEQARRFVDKDLNRSFGKDELSDPSLGGYEANRAKVINHHIGPKDNARTDFIIDMHTTTSNMGVCLIIRELNKINLECCAYIKERMDDVFIYFLPWNGEPESDHPFLNSITPYGICLEVGPIANAVVRHDILNQTNRAVELMVEYLELHNNGTVPQLSSEIEAFSYAGTIKYPHDESGKFTGFIHESLQDNDYKPLKKGDPVFQMLDGSVQYWEEDETVYPVFINEAAYYYEYKAFSITRREMLPV